MAGYGEEEDHFHFRTLMSKVLDTSAVLNVNLLIEKRGMVRISESCMVGSWD
jgi:hypothetical protein